MIKKKGNAKTGGGFTPSLPLPHQDILMGRVSRTLITFRVLGIVSIPTGVTKAAGRSPRSVRTFWDNPKSSDVIRVFF